MVKQHRQTSLPLGKLKISGPKKVVSFPSGNDHIPEITVKPSEIRLNDYESKIVVEDQKEIVRLRRWFTGAITILFIIQTIFLLFLLVGFLALDEWNLHSVFATNGHSVSEIADAVSKTRYLTNSVVLELISATMLEVAASAAAITYFLFKAGGGPKKKEPSDE